MEKWLIHTKKADFDELARKFNISPILARIIRNRDVIDDIDINQYLYGTIDDMNSPWLLKDMEKAVSIVLQKIQTGSHIRVIGDYDIDGICSSYILVNALENVGAVIDQVIPDRVTDGYGINENLIDCAYESGVDTIITCDNGISAIDAINHAKELGMTIIVTDHHNIPYITENDKIIYLESLADAIINPKQTCCNYPFKDLCGAGVAYKLIEAVYEKLDAGKEKCSQYLEYAAIATIGDVVDLRKENRIIAKYGLSLLNQTKNVGLKALIKVNNLENKEIGSYHIGFVLGPCLNSSGRLSTAKLAVLLLNETNENIAMEKALELKKLNDTRKEMTNQAVKEAVEIVEKTDIHNDKVLVIYLPDCHESIAGIVAGRLKDKYNKPAFVLTNAKSGVKGSGRSIDSYNMADELVKCKELLTKFGGHPMAAGLSLNEENIDQLRNTLNSSTTLTLQDMYKKLWIDVPVPFEYLNENLVLELSKLEPFGMGNEKPVFAEKDVKVRRLTLLGEMKNVLRLNLENRYNQKITAIAFDYDETNLNYLINKFGENELEKAKNGLDNLINISVIYYPQINEYNGYKEVRVMIKTII